jgi:DNA-binding beta-propeller fold protein YncE
MVATLISVAAVAAEAPPSLVTSWGSCRTGPGQFGYGGPRGIAVDNSGNILVVDTNNDRIQKFSPTGAHLATWGGSGTAVGQFMRPAGIAVSPTSGAVYVADQGNRRIVRLDANGTNATAFVPDTYAPNGIGVDGAGAVYIASLANLVYKYAADGTYLTYWGSRWGDPSSRDGELWEPRGVAVRPDGTFYVADTKNARVQKFGSNGHSS